MTERLLPGVLFKIMSSTEKILYNSKVLNIFVSFLDMYMDDLIAFVSLYYIPIVPSETRKGSQISYNTIVSYHADARN